MPIALDVFMVTVGSLLVTSGVVYGVVFLVSRRRSDSSEALTRRFIVFPISRILMGLMFVLAPFAIGLAEAAGALGVGSYLCWRFSSRRPASS